MYFDNLEHTSKVLLCSGDRNLCLFAEANGIATVQSVLRSPAVDKDVKEALSELMVFTSEVIGSDGARVRLRHEQNGYALMFGASSGFLTPNVPDVRSPILVHLHGPEGREEYAVDLLEEEPAPVLQAVQGLLHDTQAVALQVTQHDFGINCVFWAAQFIKGIAVRLDRRIVVSHFKCGGSAPDAVDPFGNSEAI